MGDAGQGRRLRTEGVCRHAGCRGRQIVRLRKIDGATFGRRHHHGLHLRAAFQATSTSHCDACRPPSNYPTNRRVMLPTTMPTPLPTTLPTLPTTLPTGCV